ncbi:MAG TPA: 50S ribosomal protein L15 [Bacteroidota bacterium]|nr:50S ribosomal protein L15 [Bacteroidota bacterium]
MPKPILSNLTYAPGSRKRRKRIARGQGSGHGGTSTRGHKGEGARSGTHYRPWFEGGQMPLIRRVPKFGFVPPHRVEFQIVNVATLNELAAAKRIDGGKVTPASLYDAGAVRKKHAPVKILGEGDITVKLEVHAHAFSKTALEKIQKAGGTATTISSEKK